MSDLAERLSVRLARAWVAVYTHGLPVDYRDARRAEISSDLWEHCHDGSVDGLGGVDARVLGRVIAGMPADIAWRVEERRHIRNGSAMAASSHGSWAQRHLIIIIPCITVLAMVVMLAALPSVVAALVAGMMALALISLIRGIVGSPIGTSLGKGTHMDTGIDHRRRTTLLIVLALSVIVLAGTYAYATSLDHWGDTKTLIFTVLSLSSLAVGVGALILLVADIARSHRH